MRNHGDFRAVTLLFPTPVVYNGNDSRFLQRDGARFLPALADRGDQGIKIVLASATHPQKSSSPNLRVSTFAEWCDTAFWASFKANGALCYFGFSARRFLSVMHAMRNANLRLALKADSSFGLHRFPRLASVWFRKCYWVARQHHPPAAALAKAALDFAKWIRGFDARTMLPYLESFDTITVESELAADNTCDWLRRHRRPDLANRVVFLPHPVPDDFVFDSSRHPKANRVLAVAQDWRNPRKGGFILGGALDRFLSCHTNWRATIVGLNSDLVAAAAPNVRDRIDIRPPLDSSCLLPLYQSAKILLIASGSESGPIVAFEALACGCSIVYPPELFQLSWTTDAGCGVMAVHRSAAAFSSALEKEAAILESTSRRPPLDSIPPLHASDILSKLFSNPPI